eukprot:1582891-Pyramimonas_sp.AAC.2
MTAEARRIFQYNATAEPPSRRPLRPFKQCSLLNAGLCSQDVWHNKATVGTFNLYVTMSRPGVNVFPRILRMTVGEPTEFHFIVRFLAL